MEEAAFVIPFKEQPNSRSKALSFGEKSLRNVLTADPEWSISAIVLWEITKLHQLGRIAYGLNDAAFAAAVDRVQVWPITRQVCLHLHKLDFESDPADEIIAATSLTHNLPLLTRDARIRKSKLAQIA